MDLVFAERNNLHTIWPEYQSEMDGNGLLEYQHSTIIIIQGVYRYRTLKFDDI